MSYTKEKQVINTEVQLKKYNKMNNLFSYIKKSEIIIPAFILLQIPIIYFSNDELNMFNAIQLCFIAVSIDSFFNKLESINFSLVIRKLGNIVLLIIITFLAAKQGKIENFNSTILINTALSVGLIGFILLVARLGSYKL